MEQFFEWLLTKPNWITYILLLGISLTFWAVVGFVIWAVIQ